METQRSASTVAVLIGLPASAAIVAASSSRRSATSSAARSSTAARSCWGKSAGLEGRVRGLDRALDQRCVAQRDPADDAAVVGALHLAPLAGLDPLAGGEELVIGCLDGLRRHRVLLRISSPSSVRPGRSAGRYS